MNFDLPFACLKDLQVEREADRLSCDTVSYVRYTTLSWLKLIGSAVRNLPKTP